MIQDDYLLRMIRRAAAAISRAFGLRQADQPDEADEALNSAAQSLTGLSLATLRQLDAPSASMLMADIEGPNVALLLLAARLLHASDRPSDHERAVALLQVAWSSPDAAFDRARLPREAVTEALEALAAGNPPPELV
jgi:hypothetical protein